MKKGIVKSSKHRETKGVVKKPVDSVVMIEGSAYKVMLTPALGSGRSASWHRKA